MKSFSHYLTSCIAILLLTSCSNGATVSLPAAPAKQERVHFTLVIPHPKQSTQGRRQYISQGTQSVDINSQNFNVSAASPGCSSSGANVVCTLSVDAPNTGYAQFTVSGYDQPLTAEGQTQGKVLERGTAYATINEGAANTVSVTLGGVAAQVSMSIADLTPPIGTPANIPVTFQAADADGFAIIGDIDGGISLNIDHGAPGAEFVVTNGNQVLPYDTITNSSDTVVLQYKGHWASPSTVTAKANGVTLYSASFIPQPAYGPEIPIATSLVGSIAFSSRQWTFFTEPASNAIGAIQDGTTTVVNLPTPSGGAPVRGAFFPDTGTSAGIAFVESNNTFGVATVGPYVANMQINDYPITSSSPNPNVYQVAFGQIGMKTYGYLTEQAAGKIGIMTCSIYCSGTALPSTVEYSTGVPNSAPAGITADPIGSRAQFGDGVFFADPGTSAIGFIDGNQTITEFPLPTAGSLPTDIVTAKDGSVWFTERNAARIGRMDRVTHAISEYPSDGMPVAIVDGFEGDVLLLTSAGTIDDYDPSGNHISFTPPASSNGSLTGLGNSDLYGDLILLRSDGTVGSLQHFYFK